MEFVGKAGESGGGMYVVSILQRVFKNQCTIFYIMKHKVWMLFLTHLSDLHRALSSLARATLESAVQER